MTVKTKLVPVDIKRHNDKKKGHPHVIVDSVDNRYVSVGLTSDPKKGKNSTNYKCEQNPLGGKSTSYMRRQGTVDLKKNYINPSKGNMTPKDYSRAKEYGERAKQKYLKNKQKK